MASASGSTPNAARTLRRSPDLMLRTYRECITAGDRSAANRAAALLGLSDDIVQRVVARDEAARKAGEETPRAGDDPELPPAPVDAPRPGDAEPLPAGAEMPELPERQGLPYDGLPDNGEMEPRHGGERPLSSGGELPEERPAQPSRPSTNANRQSVPDWST